MLARWTVPVGALAILAGMAACTPDAAHVTLVPVDNPCGQPAAARNIRITGYATSGERTRALTTEETVDLADFPRDTVQFGVEVEVGGGAIGAVGKTAPLDFANLDDAAVLPIFMAPLDGYCPTPGQMATPRIAPLLARAGSGVLVLGGEDADGAPLKTAELYDMATGTFTPVLVPEVLGESGFAGSAVTPISATEVAISGGPRPVITIFDATTKSFGESVLIESRSFHVAARVDEGLFVAGGCSDFAGSVCVQRKSSKIYDLASLGMFTIGPNLRVARVGAQVFDLGPSSTLATQLVIAGGTSLGPADGADLVVIGQADATALAGAYGQAAALDGGAVLTAFAPDGTADGAASVLVPGATTARAIARAPDRDGVRLIDTEEGRVLAFGGAADGSVLSYDPTLDRWDAVAPAGVPPVGTLAGASLLRLLDGSILALGGRVDGAATAEAWIYRPSLVGATSGSIVVDPGNTRTVLTPVDPASVTRSPTWELTGGETLARALVGGPRMATGSVLATVRVREGGFALVAQQRGPGVALVAELRPGEPARIVSTTQDGDVVCTGDVVPALAADAPTTARFIVTATTREVVLDGATVVACGGSGQGSGSWGVAALPGSRVVVDTVTVAR